MADGVLADAHIVSCRDALSVYERATGADLAPEGTGRGGRKAQCFLKTSAEVVT